MRAVNATGNGVASYTTTAIAPAAATLTASSVKYATGTLTIGLHSGNWYYKYTVPSGGTCQGPVSGSSKNLTGLASNTRYTFKAYSDSACSTELTIDASDADFSTRLGKLAGVQVEPRHQSLAISWTAVDGADGYTIYSKSGNQNWVTPIKSVTGATSSTLSSLTNGVEYSLRVNAFKNYQYGRWFSKVYGTWSDVVTGTPATQRPDKPSAPTLTDGTNNGELNVAWMSPGNGGAAITGYGVQYRKASADTWDGPHPQRHRHHRHHHRAHGRRQLPGAGAGHQQRRQQPMVGCRHAPGARHHQHRAARALQTRRRGRQRHRKAELALRRQRWLGHHRLGGPAGGKNRRKQNLR